MTAESLTSVIMVTYFTGPALEAAIDSVLAQDATVELILVNNGNPPEVEAALTERFKDDPNVRLLTGHGNIGFSRAVNLGARMASGEYILISGPNCVLPTHAVATFIMRRGQVKKAALIGAKLVNLQGQEVDGSRRAILSPQAVAVETLGLYRRYPNKRVKLHLNPAPAKPCQVPAIGGLCMFMTKADFEHARGFSEKYFVFAADMDFCLHFREKGGGIYFLPDLQITVRPKPSRANPIAAEKDLAKGMVRYFHENFSYHTYQPILWGVYACIWVRAGLHMALAKAGLRK